MPYLLVRCPTDDPKDASWVNETVYSDLGEARKDAAQEQELAGVTIKVIEVPEGTTFRVQSDPEKR